MTKLWLTDKSYTLCGILLRIAYWLAAIFISSRYVLNYSQQNNFKIGLMLISFLFVIGFLGFARILDHFFKTAKQ